MGGLDLEVLFHHRRDARRRVARRRAGVWVEREMDCWIVIAAAQTTKFRRPVLSRLPALRHARRFSTSPAAIADLLARHARHSARKRRWAAATIN